MKHRMITCLCFIFISSLSLSTILCKITITHEFTLLKHSSLHKQLVPPKLLFRRFTKTGTGYIYVSSVNKMYQLYSSSLQMVAERITGPKNFSLFCIPSSESCANCAQHIENPFIPGYTPDNCGPRPTDAFIKSWATSNFEESKNWSKQSMVADMRIFQANVSANNDFYALEDALYVCYNIFHGFCERIQLTNISISIPWSRIPINNNGHVQYSTIPIPVVNANASLASTIVVDRNYIYVAVEGDQLQDYTLVNLDPLSTRFRDFNLVSKKPGPVSALNFRVNDFRIQYKLSFQYTMVQQTGSRWRSLNSIPHIYFFMQQQSSLESKQWITKISRICLEDTRYLSYIELNVVCDNCTVIQSGSTPKHFNALHVASRGSVGTILARKRWKKLTSSKILPKQLRNSVFSKDFSNVLAVAFAPQAPDPLKKASHHYSDRFNTRDRDPFADRLMRGTSITFYTMAEVDAWFKFVFFNCLQGADNIGPSHFITPNSHLKCKKNTHLLHQLNDTSYCPTRMQFNYPISGSSVEERLAAPAILVLEVDVTALALIQVADNFSVLIITTDEGVLSKYSVEADDKPARLLSSKQLTPRKQPIRDLTVDDSGLVAFATSDEKVFRVDLQNCAASVSCQACLAQQDPYCGWCVAEGRCIHKTVCSPTLLNLHPNAWLSYLIQPDLCPNITHISPPGVQGFPASANKEYIALQSRVNSQYHPKPIIFIISQQLTDLLLTGEDNYQVYQHHAIKGGQPRRFLCGFRQIVQSENGVESKAPGDIIAQTDATLNGNEVSCLSPYIVNLPKIPDFESSSKIAIWLELVNKRTKGDKQRSPFIRSQPLVGADFSIYDCQRLTDCRACASSRFGCAWCLVEGRCLQPYGYPQCLSLPAFPAITGPAPDFPSAQAAPNCSFIQTGSECSCPKFQTDSMFFSVETGKKITVTFKVFNIESFAKRFSCSEQCTGRRSEGIYSRADSIVVCNFDGISTSDVVERSKIGGSSDLVDSWHPHLGEFFHHGSTNCTINLYWHNEELPQQNVSAGHPLINEANSSIEVFACSLMAEYCDSCLALPSRFECGWCLTGHRDSGSCTRSDCCSSFPIGNDSVWLRPSVSCHNPRILTVIPMNATLDGQAVVTIRGVNLGLTLDSMQTRIVVVDQPVKTCTLLQEGFFPSRQVKCRIEPSNFVTKSPDTPFHASIELSLLSNQNEKASASFTFLTPSISAVNPVKGPASGGTLVKIHGKNLNVGENISVILLHFDTSWVNCSLVILSPDLLTCRTSAVQPSLIPINSGGGDPEEVVSTDDGALMTVTVLHDKTRHKSSFFLFTPDPIVNPVTTSAVLLGGGTTLRANGRFLDSVESPMVVFYYKGWEYRHACQIRNGRLVCLSPVLLAPRNTVSRMDIVRQKRSSSDSSSDAPIKTEVVLSDRLEALAKRFAALNIDTDWLPTDSSNWPENPPVMDANTQMLIPYGFLMDNVQDVAVVGTIMVLPNPQVLPFPDGRRVEPLTTAATSGEENEEEDVEGTGLKTPPPSSTISSTSRDRQPLRLHGQFLGLMDWKQLQSSEELSIRVGDNHTCVVTIVTQDEMRCDLNLQGLLEGEDYPVEIKFGQFLIARPGNLQFKPLGMFVPGGRDWKVIIICSLIGIAFLFLPLVILAIWCYFNRLEQGLEAKFQTRWAEQEKCVAQVFKQEFMELQTHMTEFAQDLNKSSLPIRDYQTYCLFSLFPEYHWKLMQPNDPHYTPTVDEVYKGFWRNSNSSESYGDMHSHPLISKFHVPIEVREVADRGIFLFNRLIGNQHFLFLFVRVIEEDRNVEAREKSNAASLLSIILQGKMDYLTRIILLLISDLLRKSREHGEDSRLLTVFRRAESVVAKMLSNWFSFLLYNFIKERAGEPLFFLYRALLQQINTGPRDSVTGNARYTLDTATLLKSDFLSSPIVLQVVDPEGLFNLGAEQFTVKLLQCDTITQAKEKILDSIYRNTPYSSQIRPFDVHLEKIMDPNTTDTRTRIGRNRGILMKDYDLKIRRDASKAAAEGPPYRLNCLSDYKLVDNDIVALVRSSCPPYNVHLRSPGTVSSAVHGDLLTKLNNTANTLSNCHRLETPNLQLEFPDSSRLLSNPSHSEQCLFRTPHSIKPTGPPDAQLWYHLERPSNSEMKNSFRGGGGGFMNSGSKTIYKGLGNAWIRNDSCCPNDFVNEHSIKSPFREFSRLIKKNRRRIDSGLPGVDAANLKRWLDMDVQNMDITERANTSRRVKKRRQQTNRGDSHEHVQLTHGEENQSLERRMTQLPCEVFLNRLLKTRVSVVNFMDNVVDVIFGVVVDSQNTPLCVKFLFDFLDQQAELLGIHDQDIVHAWKSNCFNLRFWNQILINLDYIFDISLLRNTALDRSLHSFSQSITYACSPVLEKVTKDSPFNKALFAADIETNWTRVKEYYAQIKGMQPISQYSMNCFLQQHSNQHQEDFNISWALYELFCRHVLRCYDVLVERLASAATNGTPSPLFPECDDLGNYACTDSFLAGSGKTSSQDVTWEPLVLLQTLQEVHQCLVTVANSRENINIVSAEPNPLTQQMRGDNCSLESTRCFHHSTLTSTPQQLFPPPPQQRDLPPLPNEKEMVTKKPHIFLI